MDKNSTKHLSKIHPELARRVELAVAQLAERGLDVRVVQGLRTYAEQDALYAQGRTKPGHIVTKARAGTSNHNFGLAVDCCPFIDGKPEWNNNSLFNLIGQSGVKHGLDWGGNWKKFIDKPHLELATGLTTAQCRMLFEKGGLQAVWDRASKLIESTAAATKPAKPDAPSVTTKQTNRPATPPPPITLKRGSKGKLVVQLQRKLNAQHGANLKADGDYGAATERFIKGLQLTHGLRVDGIFGPSTAAALGM